jgi:proline iminopeptidase
MSDDEAVRLAAAKAWSVWEGSILKLIPDPELIEHSSEDQFALAVARIEAHYFVNNAFFDTDNYLIENVDKIRHIPAVIVQGRYDIVCPMMSAWELHRAWPEAKMHIVPDAGHASTETGIIAGLVEATDNFRGVK